MKVDTFVLLVVKETLDYLLSPLSLITSGICGSLVGLKKVSCLKTSGVRHRVYCNAYVDVLKIDSMNNVLSKYIGQAVMNTITYLHGLFIETEKR